MLYRHLCIICLFIVIFFSRCSTSADNNPAFKSPDGYNLNKPFLLKLPVELDEISGVAFYARDTSLFAIGDEFGWLYKIPLTGNKPIQKWKFSNQGDYEDLVMVDKVFYVLQSNGNITAFTFDDHNQILTQNQEFPASGNEFEILYYDPRLFKLILICKDCETDKKKALTAYYFNLLYKRLDDSSSINVTAIANMIGEKKIKFKPSAAAIHPVTNELFIVSSVNKLLVITDRKGQVKQTYHLDAALFKQPEGITFTPEGDMIISNEAADRGVANLLFFKYNKKVKP
ncbi:SdiA-regulated domain-containing protein [Longitalea arenae]|uniref:SdiA-regulated domain-containing protein n=1 Tax=Longitalea arenae TaxID=2812558 RepID=UPI0019678969|nr:SdiA-regulated domain-containing protein [Longitalea arenae]